MKKIILTLVAACAIAVSANAQFYGSGSVGFDLSSSNGVSSSAWHIAPGFGYNLSEKSSVGLFLVLGGAGGEFEWNFNPYYRYRFASYKNIHFFADGAFKIGQRAKMTEWGIGVVPGISYTLSDRTSIVAHVAYVGLQGIDGSTAFRFNLLKTSTIGVELKF